MSANMLHKEWQQRNKTLPECIEIRINYKGMTFHWKISTDGKGTTVIKDQNTGKTA
jgi:hypothetical protein